VFRRNVLDGRRLDQHTLVAGDGLGALGLHGVSVCFIR
jgi:hypothetical protein